MSAKAWTNPNSRRYQVIFVLLVCIISIGAIYYYSTVLQWYDPLFGIYAHINGIAPKPYIFRVLIPLSVRILFSIFPSFDPKLIASVLLYFLFIGYILSIRYLVKAFWKVSVTIDFAVLLSPIALAPLMMVANHIYDLGILFLFTLGLALLGHRRFPWFILIFPFICLAKETAVLLTIFYAIFYFRRLYRPTYLVFLSLQIALFTLIRIGLTIAFRDNPGGNIDYHVSEWLLALSISPTLLFSFYGIFGAVIAILVISYWKDKPVFLRYFIGIILPILILLHTIFGIPYELRVFYEAFPVLYLLSMFTIYKLLRIGFVNRAASANSFV